MSTPIKPQDNFLAKPLRHAYLVVAHRDDITFRTLISMLDDSRNDIFVHMDRKNKAFCAESLGRLVNHSRIFIVSPRASVSWGGYSQIRTALLLLKEATKHGRYAYYHLISGQDLPIKTQDYIHDFFDRNQGKEFVRFQNQTFCTILENLQTSFLFFLCNNR